MKAELLTLRVIHILGGIFWVGSMLYATFFLAPALRSSPQVAGQVMAGFRSGVSSSSFRPLRSLRSQVVSACCGSLQPGLMTRISPRPRAGPSAWVQARQSSLFFSQCS